MPPATNRLAAVRARPAVVLAVRSRHGRRRVRHWRGHVVASARSVLVALHAGVGALAVRLLRRPRVRPGRALSVALRSVLLVAMVAMVASLLLHRGLLHVGAVDFAKALGHRTGVLVLLGHHVLVLVSNRHVGWVREARHRTLNTIRDAAARGILRAWAVLGKLRVLGVVAVALVVAVVVRVVRHPHSGRRGRCVVVALLHPSLCLLVHLRRRLLLRWVLLSLLGLLLSLLLGLLYLLLLGLLLGLLLLLLSLLLKRNLLHLRHGLLTARRRLGSTTTSTSALRSSLSSRQLLGRR